jgi:hypothetical protein
MVGRAVDVTVPSRAASKEVTHSATKTNQKRRSCLKVNFDATSATSAGGVSTDSGGLFLVSIAFVGESQVGVRKDRRFESFATREK